jgi:formylglycine-generating enzyme required for sulfatase activity
VIDTDLPASLQLRLRVDVFGQDRVWLDARETARPLATDFPASFSIFLPDASDDARDVRVRLRLYPEGQVRDYRGERFAPPHASTSTVQASPGGDLPRLLREGRDVTPATEPAPEASVDRLLIVRLRRGVRGSLRVALRGACIGTMSDISGDTTCESASAPLVPVLPSIIVEGALDTLGSSEVGQFAQVEPPPTPARTEVEGLYNAQVAVTGGAFVLGGRQLANEGGELGATPARVVVVSSFLVDQHEFTVARFRALLARGFRAPDPPLENVAEDDFSDCSWSFAPLSGGARREDRPLSCVSYQTARAACLYDHGDLPTEAEWEYVASAWNRPAKTIFPWGVEAPSCDAVAFGRFPMVAGAGDNSCVTRGARPGALPVFAASGDATVGSTDERHVMGLAGNLAEWTLDTYAPYSSTCWADGPKRDPQCTKSELGTLSTIRGGSYATDAASLITVFRHPLAKSAAGYRDIGFRCVTRP